MAESPLLAEYCQMIFNTRFGEFARRSYFGRRNSRIFLYDSYDFITCFLPFFKDSFWVSLWASFWGSTNLIFTSYHQCQLNPVGIIFLSNPGLRPMVEFPTLGNGVGTAPCTFTATYKSENLLNSSVPADACASLKVLLNRHQHRPRIGKYQPVGVSIDGDGAGKEEI